MRRYGGSWMGVGTAECRRRVGRVVRRHGSRVASALASTCATIAGVGSGFDEEERGRSHGSVELMKTCSPALRLRRRRTSGLSKTNPRCSSAAHEPRFRGRLPRTHRAFCSLTVNRPQTDSVALLREDRGR